MLNLVKYFLCSNSKAGGSFHQGVQPQVLFRYAPKFRRYLMSEATQVIFKFFAAITPRRSV